MPHPWPLRRAAALLVALMLVAAAFIASYEVYAATGIKAGPDEYNLAAWETRKFDGKWLFLTGQLFRGKPGLDEQNARLLRFLQLTRDIDALEREESDAAQRGLSRDQSRAADLAKKRRERDSIENDTEATIEGRLTSAIKDAGVTRSFLVLHGVVWPPVDFEFTDPPRTLATSPRERIQLKSTQLLREDLTLPQIEAIEEEKKRRDNLAALAFPTGGIGAYPTIVSYEGDYASLLTLVAHEWTHNYLFFRPLGFNYYANSDVRAMNETVADLVGHELAQVVLAKWPLPGDNAPQQQSSEAPAVDVGAELRRLRLEVDELLAAGKVDEAEALMEQRRQELAARGVRIRKLNQAYFAFVNLYAGQAGNPASTNPIGPKIDELRRRTGSLSAFVRVVGGISSVSELDRTLAQLQ